MSTSDSDKRSFFGLQHPILRRTITRLVSHDEFQHVNGLQKHQNLKLRWTAPALFYGYREFWGVERLWVCSMMVDHLIDFVEIKRGPPASRSI